jgi:acyl carrier protein
MSASVRATIVSQFEQVASEQKRKLAPLSDGLVLMESGLDSLCFAIIVARLEDTLGFDPFGVAEDARFPVTFGDFTKFYADAAK